MSETAKESWDSGGAYELWVGRWSRKIAEEFIAWLRHRSEANLGRCRLWNGRTGSKAPIYAEVGEIFAGRIPKPPPGTTVVFKSVGIAIEDIAAAKLVYEASGSSRRDV